MGESDRGRTENANSRKRKADALGRIEAGSSFTGGRGALVGWTTCPLCGKYSAKRFAHGRGIANHLHAVHTPWNPGKIEQKKRQRQEERRRAELRRHGLSPEDVKRKQNLQVWEPTEKERSDWDARVLRIVKELEAEALRDGKATCESQGGIDRTGIIVRSYRDSLPPFIQAAADGNLEKLKRMFRHTVDEGKSIVDLIDTRDRHLSTADHWAAGGGHLDCLKYLMHLRKEHIDHRKDRPKKKIRRRDGKTCLHYAARNGMEDCLRYLIEEEGFDVEETSGDGTTAFHLACFGGHLKAVEYLLCEANADARKKNDFGCSAAHWIAISQGESVDDLSKICSLLVDLGVSFTALQNQGHSALHKAAQKKNKMIIKWIFENHPKEELLLASRPDEGGHRPVEIWLSGGGSKEFADWMSKRLAAD